jgi:hypothetical protein
MPLFNCQCLYSYDKEVLIEALGDYIAKFGFPRSRSVTRTMDKLKTEFESNPKMRTYYPLAKRALELQEYILTTPNCKERKR